MVCPARRSSIASPDPRSRPLTLPRFERVLWLLPCILVLHVAEECAAGFPRYVGEALHGAPMSVDGLLQGNALFLGVLVALCWRAGRGGGRLAAFLLIAWASGHLFWNFAFHLWTTASKGHHATRQGPKITSVPEV